MHFSCLANPHNHVRDFVLITCPWTYSQLPLMAPAVLKPVIEKQGLSCLAVDLNIEVVNMVGVKRDTDKVIGTDDDNSILDFFFHERCSPDQADWLHDMFESIARGILSWQPKYVGLSLLSYVCQKGAKWIAYYIKKIRPDVIVIAGGPGCLDTFTGPSSFIAELLDSGLLDYHVRGDGEHSLTELLKQNSQYPGINDIEWKELSRRDLAVLPRPDYSDYNFDFYELKVIPLLGSRGCVRKCTFCDYIANWKTYTWRTADDIFEEMVFQSTQYGITQFKFQDSLTNGNLKEFSRLTELLANYNRDPNNQPISWAGFYIFRDVTARSEHEWQMIAESGCMALIVGIENLNERIRYSMGKKFSNVSIDYHLAQAKKHGITLQLMNLVGYVDETRADIDFIRQWLIDHVEYRHNIKLQWGGTLGLFPNTWLDQNAEKLGVIRISSDPSQWINPKINSTPELRASWARELNDFSRQLGYDVFDNIENHFVLEQLLNG